MTTIGPMDGTVVFFGDFMDTIQGYATVAGAIEGRGELDLHQHNSIKKSRL